MSVLTDSKEDTAAHGNKPTHKQLASSLARPFTRIEDYLRISHVVASYEACIRTYMFGTVFQGPPESFSLNRFCPSCKASEASCKPTSRLDNCVVTYGHARAYVITFTERSVNMCAHINPCTQWRVTAPLAYSLHVEDCKV